MKQLNRIFQGNVRIGGMHIPTINLLWFVMALAIAGIRISGGRGGMNNYLLFEGIIRHLANKQNIFWDFWWEYDDANHYGPSFSVVIAPFAILHPLVGCFLWCLANAAILLYAMRRLPLSTLQQNLVLAFSLVELSTSLSNVQFNPMLSAWFMLSWVWVQEGKDFRAAMFIALGFLVKLYGIVGLAFLLCSGNRKRFLLGFLFWLLVWGAAPLLFTSPDFLIQTYYDWYESLQLKHSKNLNLHDTDLSQDISAPGLMRRMFGFSSFRDLWMLAPAALLMGLPMLRFLTKEMSKQARFQLLGLVMVSVVIFSNAAESATYILAVAGIAVWAFGHEKPLPLLHRILLALVLVFSSLSSTDLFPAFIRREIIWPYAVKALPVTLCWLLMVWEFWKEAFRKVTSVQS
ncbi:MAG: hypothetical protein RL160_630 [Bacteroidota bacterium]|jgi:hypothetical protein